MGSRQEPIECRSLTKRFGDTTAVDELTFNVAAGTVTGFVGANGAGKTTTMRMILGLVRPSAGEALINGRRYRDLADPRRKVGAALESPGAHPGHRASTHLRAITTAAGLPSSRVGEVLDLVELDGSARRRVGAFSTGMRQRLALATAMLGDPSILILDEPVNGLDPAGILWMRDFLRGLAREGRAVLVSSHLLAELAEVADRVVIIDHGRLVADSTLAELLNGRKQVEVHCAHPENLAAALRGRGVHVEIDLGVVVVQGLPAREVGDIAAAVDAGPVWRLAERPGSFESAYFELAGTIRQPSSAPERSAS
jgi:ABC-2 type transport system ATP-binding protein